MYIIGHFEAEYVENYYQWTMPCCSALGHNGGWCMDPLHASQSKHHEAWVWCRQLFRCMGKQHSRPLGDFPFLIVKICPFSTSLPQIHEFVKFRERLQNSLQYVGGTAERILLDMILDISRYDTAAHRATVGPMLCRHFSASLADSDTRMVYFSVFSHQKTEEMVKLMDIDPEQDKTVFEDLQDNRDMQVLPSWDPPDR